MGIYSSSENNEQKKAIFNSTLAILYRIDELWQQAHRIAISGDLMKWNWILDRIWCELAADSNEEDFNKIKELNEEIKKIIENREKIEIKKSILYKKILKKEIFLRQLQNIQGKGVKYEQNIEDYMD